MNQQAYEDFDYLSDRWEEADHNNRQELTKYYRSRFNSLKREHPEEYAAWSEDVHMKLLGC